MMMSMSTYYLTIVLVIAWFFALAFAIYFAVKLQFSQA